MTKFALISGISGMDGSYLSEFLLNKNYKVYGIIRRSSLFNLSRLNGIRHNKNLILKYGDVTDSANLNADVICFNNKKALKRIIDLTIEHFTEFSEQGGLNELAFVDKSYEVNIIDGPYPISSVVYNVRSKGVFGTDMIKQGKLAKHGPRDGEWSPVHYWFTKDDKLYTLDNKQIKVFHFAEGLGVQPKEEFFNKLNDFKTWFNKETIEFFNTKCNCKHFFNDNV